MVARRISLDNYYPCGMIMPGRSFSSSSGYRYGFNGMEKDDEVKGGGNYVDFGARGYDPRIGRWLSTDPLEFEYPHASPYNFVLNTPIQAIDPDGKRVYFLNEEDATRLVNNLNKLYKRMYDFEMAFSMVTYEHVSMVKNPEYGIMDKLGLDDDPEFIEQREFRSYITTNEDFDWNRDIYTSAMFDVLNVDSDIMGDIVCDDCPDYTKHFRVTQRGFYVDRGGGFTLDNSSFILSEKLNDDGEGGYTLAVVAIHELTHHLHPMGIELQIDPTIIRRAYGDSKTGTDHGGGNRQNPAFSDPAERQRLNDLRENTGTNQETEDDEN